MQDCSTRVKRTTYTWSQAARSLIADHAQARGPELRQLVSDLTQMSGYPRAACRRFVRQCGLRAKNPYRKWSEAEKRRLVSLIELHPVCDVVRLMGRTRRAIDAMLYRLGIRLRSDGNSFTKRSLATLLHVRVEQIELWINRGLLKAHVKEARESAHMTWIAAEDFYEFCKQHREEIVGHRLNARRLEFVYRYVFPSGHQELLAVRQSKKERAAFEAQQDADDSELDVETDTNEEGGSAGLTA
jgi:hypothetical protein